MACTMKIFGSKKLLYLDVLDENMTVDEAISEAVMEALPDTLPIYCKEDTGEVEIDGAVDPDGLRKAAGEWNENIRQEAIKAAKVWMHKPELDNLDSYRLRQAMEAADNIFYYGGSYVTLSENDYGLVSMHTLIPEWMMADVSKNPADYAIATIAYDD